MAISTLASAVQYDISSTLTDIPGTQNIQVESQENMSFKSGGIADAVDSNLGTGTSTPGKVSFEMLYDPSNVVHKQMQEDHLAGGVSAGIAVEISATGGIWTATATLKTFNLSADKHDGWKAQVELECENGFSITDPTP